MPPTRRDMLPNVNALLTLTLGPTKTEILRKTEGEIVLVALVDILHAFSADIKIPIFAEITVIEIIFLQGPLKSF